VEGASCCRTVSGCQFVSCEGLGRGHCWQFQRAEAGLTRDLGSPEYFSTQSLAVMPFLMTSLVKDVLATEINVLPHLPPREGQPPAAKVSVSTSCSLSFRKQVSFPELFPE
jgi:hypothetical protein